MSGWGVNTDFVKQIIAYQARGRFKILIKEGWRQLTTAPSRTPRKGTCLLGSQKPGEEDEKQTCCVEAVHQNCKERALTVCAYEQKSIRTSNKEGKEKMGGQCLWDKLKGGEQAPIFG